MPHDPIHAKETLEYVGSMLGQLRDMTEAQKQPFLTLLLGMAYVHTYDTLRSIRQKEIEEKLEIDKSGEGGNAVRLLKRRKAVHS